jgi:hypothetical protein
MTFSPRSPLLLASLMEHRATHSNYVKIDGRKGLAKMNVREVLQE